MSEIILQSNAIEPRPLPRVNVTIRPGVLSDVPFLDSLQKLHTKQVGWMPTAQFEGKIKLGHVLVAEVAQPTAAAERVGYCIGNDQYFKRDDVGIIYQMNVVPGRQRGLIGATLLQAMFDRAAYGCKLFCCWCAQDIAANRFWESMGFVPLAFRAGSRTKGAGGTPRVHIFWQKRIRRDDTTTPWWFPSKTDGGAIREDRIVLPIPPGTHWSDAKPLILPGDLMPGDVPVLPAPKRASMKKPKPVEQRSAVRRNGLFFDVPKLVATPPVETVMVKTEPKPPRVKAKSDPRLIAAARELRDRWLEQVNATPLVGVAKYDVSRAVGESVGVEIEPMKLLAA